MSRAISEVISSPDYAWRLPRDRAVEAEDQEPGLLSGFIEWMHEKLKAGIKAVQRWGGVSMSGWIPCFPKKSRHGRTEAMTRIGR